MTDAQVQASFTVGALAMFSGCDDADPRTWVALRLRDGLAVCAAPLPALSEPAEIREWLMACERVWLLVDEADVYWCFSRWWFGTGEAQPHDDALGEIAGEDGEALLLVMAAACALASRLFKPWVGREHVVDVDVVAVFPLRGAVES